MTIQTTDLPVAPTVDDLHEALPAPVVKTQLTIGRALEKARVRTGYSVVDAAVHLRISVRDLGNYESGVRTPSDELLEEMAALYETGAGAFGARTHEARIPPRIDFESQTLWIGRIPISLANDEGGNANVLRNLASALRKLRSLDRAQPVYLRQSEIPLIGSLLDLSSTELPTLVMHHLGLTYRETERLMNQMRGLS